MHVNNKRKSDEEGGFVPKRGKKEFATNKRGTHGPGGKPQPPKKVWKQKGELGFQDRPAKKQNDKQRNTKKKQLSAIVTEAKANYQLYSDKKIDKNEKQLLMSSTYDLVKDHIPELARMKGMGKIIGSLIDRKNKKQLIHVQNCYESLESKLLLIKGNGYRLAIKIIQNCNPKIVKEYIDACMSNGKGLRALMENFKSARVLYAAYACGNAASKKNILTKLVFGNMPLPVSNSETPLKEIFSKCKADVVEGCKMFLKSILNEKSIQQDLVQDIMLLCIETHKSTGMDIEEFLKIASENVLPLCRRTTNCTLSLWVVWLSTAQMRKHIMKTLKGKVVSVLQTYNGRMFMMALFESTDDTKALNKLVMKDFLDSLNDLVQYTEVRKLLEFLLLPRSTKFMHPKDIEILRQGDDIRTSKKSNDARFDEIREYMRDAIISALRQNCANWLKDNKLCLFIIAIVERFGDTLEINILEELAKTLASSEFSERIHDKAIQMVLESLIQADVSRYESNEEAPMFLNLFVPKLDKIQCSNMVNKSPRIVCGLFDGLTRVQKALTFKFKKSWINEKKTQDAISQWKNQKKT